MVLWGSRMGVWSAAELEIPRFFCVQGLGCLVKF